MTAKRVIAGISMRVIRDPASGERRDALARDWARFFSAIDSRGMSWVMLPNVEDACPALAQSLGVNALVLSGGDDLGATPERDRTEQILLAWAAARNLPVIGICRGMQMLQHFFGGGLVPLSAQRHVRARHAIVWRGSDAASETREVNSYHQWGLFADLLAPQLESLAICREDNSVEALRARSLPWLGLMWHPEREVAAHPADLELFRRQFATVAPGLAATSQTFR